MTKVIAVMLIVFFAMPIAVIKVSALLVKSEVRAYNFVSAGIWGLIGGMIVALMLTPTFVAHRWAFVAVVFSVCLLKIWHEWRKGPVESKQ